MAEYLLYILFLSAIFLSNSNAKPSPLDVELLTHSALGQSAADTRAAIGRRLQAAALSGRDVNHRGDYHLNINLQDVSLVKM